MKRDPVDSEALTSVGYDPDRRMLEVEFESGAVYRYYDIPPDLHAGLMAAPSRGEYFAHHIRNEGFDYIRMDCDEGAG